MKRGSWLLLLVVSLSIFSSSIFAQEDLYDQEFDEIAEEDIYQDIGDVKLVGKAGLTPDSSFYFLENLVEAVLVGDNPETALKYKEEKVLELKAMVDSGNSEAAAVALQRVEKYNQIIKREVSPKIEKRVRESSKAVKSVLNSLDDKISGDQWESLRGDIDENLKQEDKIALAAKISTKISQLCQALSGLDPLEYSKVCKTDEDDPEWKKDLDKKLTKEQEVEAKKFFAIMSQCFRNPKSCRCEDISVQPFAEKCKIIAPLAAKCDGGDEEACEQIEEVGDPIDLLPDYLQIVLENVEDQYGDSKHDLHIPKECSEVGATSRKACMRIMFKLNAPPECLAALDSGKINPKNERDARKACEKIMFDLEAPEECKDAGLKDFRECERLMFKLDAPKECIEAGLTGSSRNDHKKCDLIRFKTEAPRECIDAGITGENRDDWKKCEIIKFKADALPECLEAGLDGSGRDDWKKCDAIRFKLDAPKDCLDAGITGEGRDDWRKCDAIRFKSEAHPDCLSAGLDGSGRDDWRKCQKIQWKAEAPKECIDAGIDGTSRDDWRKCEELTKGRDSQHGQRKADCKEEEVHICDNSGFGCKCISKDDYDRHGNGEDQGGSDNTEMVCCSEPGPDDRPIYNWKDRRSCASPQGAEFTSKIVDKSQCEDNQKNSCDDCQAKCPGASSTSCEDNQCRCNYDPGTGGNIPTCTELERLECDGSECKCVSSEGAEGSTGTDKSTGTDAQDSSTDSTESGTENSGSTGSNAGSTDDSGSTDGAGSSGGSTGSTGSIETGGSTGSTEESTERSGSSESSESKSSSEVSDSSSGQTENNEATS
jgi:hypothetical protein